jgi:hypothetical protein
MNTSEFLAQKFGSPILTSDEVAQILRVKVKTFQNGLSDGRYPIKSWRRGFFHVDDVARFIDGQSSAANQPDVVGHSASASASRRDQK